MPFSSEMTGVVTSRKPPAPSFRNTRLVA
jgi:hypothetical protein